MLHQAAIKSGLEVPSGSEKVVWSVWVAWLYGVNKEIRGDCLRWEEADGVGKLVVLPISVRPEGTRMCQDFFAARVLSKRCTQRKTAARRDSSTYLILTHQTDHSTAAVEM